MRTMMKRNACVLQKIRFVAWKYEMQTTIVMDRSPEFWKIGIKKVKPQNITKMNDLGLIEIALVQHHQPSHCQCHYWCCYHIAMWDRTSILAFWHAWKKQQQRSKSNKTTEQRLSKKCETFLQLFIYFFIQIFLIAHCSLLIAYFNFIKYIFSSRASSSVSLSLSLS